MGVRAARAAELVVALASAGFAVGAAALVRPRDAATGALLVLAVVWGAVAYGCRVVVPDTPAEAPPEGPGEGPDATVTTVVRVGNEPDEVAAASIVLAAAVGPTVVATGRPRAFIADLCASLSVPVLTAPTFEQAVARAVAVVQTDAVHLVSASAFPVAGGPAGAANALRGRTGWATGRTAPFNPDAFAPSERDTRLAEARSAIRRAGTDVWEPDAMVVRTDLLRAAPLASHRPWGAWLRDRRREGWRGAERDDVLARRAAPTEAGAFWPSELRRRRAAVADLAGASGEGPWRARLLATAALLDELYACPLLVWSAACLVVAWSGRFPLRCPPQAFFAVALTLPVARWVARGVADGKGLHPRREARAVAYGLPASLLSLSSAITRTARPSRVRVPDQPLLAVAIALSLLTTVALFDRAAVADASIDVAVVFSIIELIAMWVFAVRALGKRAWERASFRLGTDVDVLVDGCPARMVNASPEGAAVVGDLAAYAPGDRVTLIVPGDGPPLTLDAEVRHECSAAGGRIVGLAPQLDLADRVTWTTRLVSGAARARAAGVVEVRPPAKRARQAALGTELAMVGVAAAIALGALAVVGLGYRPMIVRTPSMVPTLDVGDVVVTRWSSADRVRSGEIITVHDPASGQLLTHRVRSVSTLGSAVAVETRGDANIGSEHFVLQRTATVGVVVWRVPAVGEVVIALGAHAVRWVLGAVSVIVAAVAVGMAVGWAPRRAGDVRA